MACVCCPGGCCLSLIFKISGSVDSGTYSVNFNGTYFLTFSDDLDTGTCTGTRVYVLYACSGLIAELEAEYGAGCVSLVPVAYANAPLPFSSGPDYTLGCNCDGVVLNVTRPGTASTVEWEVYQGCTNCTLIGSGTLAATTSEQASDYLYHSCCGCVESEAGESLIGPDFGFVTVNPDNTPGSAPSSTRVATGLVSCANFASWHDIGTDSTNIGTTTSATTASGVVVSVSMAGDPYDSGSGPSAHLEPRNTGSSFSADFSGNESLIFVHAENATVTLTFSVPVLKVGFRVQNVGFGTNTNFFVNSNTGLSVTTSAYSPFSDTAPFYGIESGTAFTSLTFGFDSATPFAFGTVEVCVPNTSEVIVNNITDSDGNTIVDSGGSEITWS